MMRTKLWAGLILVFVLGALAGSLGTGWYFKKRIEQFAMSSPSKKSHLLMNRLIKELEITEAQKPEIERIVKQFQEEFRKIRTEIHPAMERLRESTFLSIREKLNEDQRKAFDDLRTRMERWRPGDRLRARLALMTPEKLISEMKEQLKLTDEQESKIRPVIEKSIKDQYEILDQYESRGPGKSHSLRREIRAYKISVEEKLSKILTAEQLVGLRKMLLKQQTEGHEQESGHSE